MSPLRCPVDGIRSELGPQLGLRGSGSTCPSPTPQGPAPLSGCPSHPHVPTAPPPPLQALVPFHNLGLLVGLFSPRCADLWPATRQEAVSCVYSLLYLQLGYEGEPLAGQRSRGMRSRPRPGGWGSRPAARASCLHRLLPGLPGRCGRAAAHPQRRPGAPRPCHPLPHLPQHRAGTRQAPTEGGCRLG